MRRRDLITLLGGMSVAWSLTARAQRNQGLRRLAMLVHGTQSDPDIVERTAAFHQGLESFGWIEGRNIQIESRFTDNDYDRIPQLAREVVALKPEIIFANTTPVVKALQKETRTVPIVFVQVSDPTGAGVVPSLARPGGNTTGFLFYENSIVGKWLGMLKEISPQLSRAAIIGNPKGFPYGYFLRTAKSIAPSLGIEIVPTPIADTADIERLISAFAQSPSGGLFVPPDNTVEANHDLVIALAARNRLPAVYAYRFFVKAGGLMSYGIDVPRQYRDVASYIDRILRGANPADLPVEAPTRYETLLNIRTAKALGLNVPATLLVRADEVIE